MARFAALLLAACGSGTTAPPTPDPAPVATPAAIATPAAVAEPAAARPVAPAKAGPTAQDPAALAGEQALHEPRDTGLRGAARWSGGRVASITGTGDFESGLDADARPAGLMGNEVGEMEGGLGYRLRRGMSNQPPALSTTTVGALTTRGGKLDQALIRRYLRRKLAQMSACYEKALRSEPGLVGTVSVQFGIDAEGMVNSASGRGLKQEVSDCVAAVVRPMQFPRPKDGAAVDVTVPIEFRPAAGQRAP